MAKFGLNRVILVGNLGKDPEMRYVNQEIPVTRLRLAVSEPRGKEKIATTWVDVTFWRAQAEIAHRYTRKGSSILIEGRLVEKQWETPQGDKRSRLEVEGDRLILLDKALDAGQNPTTNPAKPLGGVDPLGSLDMAEGTDDLPF